MYGGYGHSNARYSTTSSGHLAWTLSRYFGRRMLGAAESGPSLTKTALDLEANYRKRAVLRLLTGSRAECVIEAVARARIFGGSNISKRQISLPGQVEEMLADCPNTSRTPNRNSVCPHQLAVLVVRDGLQSLGCFITHEVLC